ncbi:hypothetical protein Gasu2_02550 [Galdieria sulphuraria]|nr:hypothetical protein Gasu2_02550 [Galdieria sulphuraria]
MFFCNNEEWQNTPILNVGLTECHSKSQLIFHLDQRSLCSYLYKNRGSLQWFFYFPRLEYCCDVLIRKYIHTKLVNKKNQFQFATYCFSHSWNPFVLNSDYAEKITSVLRIRISQFQRKSTSRKYFLTSLFAANSSIASILSSIEYLKSIRLQRHFDVKPNIMS